MSEPDGGRLLRQWAEAGLRWYGSPHGLDAAPREDQVVVLALVRLLDEDDRRAS